MKVLIPFSYYYPESCAGIYIVDDLIHRLAAEGHDVVMYVPTPTRNVVKGAAWKRNEYLCEGHVHIHRFHMFSERKNPFLRALRYLLCEHYYMHHMLWDKYDVAFIDSTPPIQGLKLPIVKLIRKKPVVYNAQDLFPETLSGAGLANRGGLLWRVGSWVANVTFRNSDRIIAISNDIKNNIVSKGIDPQAIEVVYDWVDYESVHYVCDHENPLFEEFGISREKFRVVYAGNLGNAQNVDLIVDAASRLKDNEKIQFVIFGSGGLENEIRARISAENLTNVVLLPLQLAERVSYVYSLGNVCLVVCKPGFGGAAMPSKTWSIMSCERAVLANFDEGELRSIIEDNGCGVYTAAGDLDAFVDAIEKLSVTPSGCDGMGAKGRVFILDNLTKEAGTSRYVEIIESVIKK